MAIDRTVPSERNNTYTPSEVSRRTPKELFDIAFNEDQKTALLSKFFEGGSGGDVGYTCETVETILFDGSVTTQEMQGWYAATLPIGHLTSDTLTVVFNGVEYQCNKYVLDGAPNTSIYGGLVYPAMDFSEFPFIISSDYSTGTGFVTENASTNSVIIKQSDVIAETTDCFDRAVHETLSKRSGISIHKTRIEAVYPQSVTIGTSTSVRPSAYIFTDPNNPDGDPIEEHNATFMQQYFDFIIPEHIRIIPGDVRLSGFDPNSGEIWVSAEGSYHLERGQISVYLYGCTFKAER